MKKAVIVMMVALFSVCTFGTDAFAGSACKNKVNTSLVSVTKADSASSSGSSSTKGTR